MKKGIKKCICVILSALMTIAAPAKTEAAVITTHFGASFGSYDPQVWEKADGWSNGGMFNCTWRASNVNFYNDTLELSITNDYNGSKPYAGGEYRTWNKFGYGLYQVCMKPAKNTGIVSSFFTYADNPWDEIDIEFLGKDTTKVQFNYYKNGVGGHEHLHNLGFDASDGFHVYGFDWRPNYIAWFVDGIEVYRTWGNMPSNPGQIMMNIWPGINVNEWLGAYDGKTPLKAYYKWVSYDPV
ncbi:MAG TPA: beta-glucanase [Lachnospiraceae bacterium]|nr:beta-glucanase [Lachnospiraceae bacterium]